MTTFIKIVGILLVFGAALAAGVSSVGIWRSLRYHIRSEGMLWGVLRSALWLIAVFTMYSVLAYMATQIISWEG